MVIFLLGIVLLMLLFRSPWSINWAEQHNEALKLSEFGNLTF